MEKAIKITCEGAGTLPLDEFKDFQGALKTLSKDKFETGKMSILKYGFSSPVALWEDHREILDGHQRVFIVRHMVENEGYVLSGEIPYVKIFAETRKEAAEKLLAVFNSKYADITDDGLYEFINNNDIDLSAMIDDGLDLADIDMDLFLAGWVDDKPEPQSDEDEIPEVPEDPVTKLGDLYQLGEHRLLCGDSTKIEDVERLMDGQKADMVFTDPPYNVAFNGRSGKFEVIENDDLSVEKFESFIGKFIDILNSVGVNTYYICCNWKFYGLMQLKLKPKSCIVWAKNVFGLGRGYRHQHEFIIFDGFVDPDIKNESDLWEIKKDTNYKHPTQKPTALAERAIYNSTKKNNIVQDYFCGSGSTLIACEKTNRKCYGMEIDPHYCDVIVKRWEDYTGKKAELISNHQE